MVREGVAEPTAPPPPPPVVAGDPGAAGEAEAPALREGMGLLCDAGGLEEAAPLPVGEPTPLPMPLPVGAALLERDVLPVLLGLAPNVREDVGL